MPKVSSIERELSEAEYEEFQDMVRSKSWTIDELVGLFAERGFEFSNTAMGLQKLKIEQVAKSNKRSRLAMEVLADKIGDDYSSSDQGEILVRELRAYTFELMATRLEDGDVDPKVLESLAKVVKNAASASRLHQDHAEKDRKRIADEEREKAASSAAEVMTEAGISLDQVKFWKKKFLGAREPKNRISAT